MHPILKALFTTRTGIYVLIGLVLLGAAALGKLYWDAENIAPEKVEATTVTEGLDGVEEALEAHLAGLAPEAPLPTNAGWSPPTLSCGRSVVPNPKDAEHATWKALGIDLTRETRYQYRFTVDGEDFELLARTDNDCDGIYQVYHLRGTMTRSGVSARPMKTDNPGE